MRIAQYLQMIVADGRLQSLNQTLYEKKCMNVAIERNLGEQPIVPIMAEHKHE